MNKNRGYTLLEILVYAFLLALLIALMANSIAALAHIVVGAKEERTLRSSAEAAMERVAREIRFAENVDTGASALDTSPGVLVLASIDPFTGNPQTVMFSIDSGKIAVQKNAGQLNYLTSDSVTITNLVFRHTVNGSISESIKTELTIGGKNFYSTTVLRRSY
jgi:type II secretory pathway pseudopilin PulG